MKGKILSSLANSSRLLSRIQKDINDDKCMLLYELIENFTIRYDKLTLKSWKKPHFFTIPKSTCFTFRTSELWRLFPYVKNMCITRKCDQAIEIPICGFQRSYEGTNCSIVEDVTALFRKFGRKASWLNEDGNPPSSPHGEKNFIFYRSFGRESKKSHQVGKFLGAWANRRDKPAKKCSMSKILGILLPPPPHGDRLRGKIR